jgi:hypothetical protein
MMRSEYEVRVVGKGPARERWLATFRMRADAEEYTPSAVTANRRMGGSYSADDLEIVKVYRRNL